MQRVSHAHSSARVLHASIKTVWEEEEEEEEFSVFWEGGVRVRTVEARHTVWREGGNGHKVPVLTRD